MSALHYSAGDRVSDGFRTVASAHALCQPTSCGSEYFYNQRPQVRNLIGTECSLNRSEHRVKKEANWILDYESQLFPVYGNRESEVSSVSGHQITGVRWMTEVTRGRVDNENNNQSQYSNISNIVQGGGLYIRVREHSH